MILPDTNLLLYAYNGAAPAHARARRWWESIMNGGKPVAIAWAVGLGFIRLSTHPAILVAPLRPMDALARVASWLERENVQILDPGPRHLAILGDLLAAVGVAGALTTDAHLAALAIEHQCELASNDADFARFPGLRWSNPIA